MLVIYSHPNKKGHNGLILKEVKRELKKRKIKFKLIDLYKINYNPLLKNKEHYTSGNYDVSNQNKKFQKLIKKHKNLIFIYPTWWNNVPAILKGFIDRVFIARFAFKYKNKIPIGLLKGKKALILTSTGGPFLFYNLIACRRSIKVLKKDTLNFCGIKSKGYAINFATKLTEKNKNKIKNKVQKGIKWINR
jgi:NAD(P)H dehydrogenase (quinone)